MFMNLFSNLGLGIVEYIDGHINTDQPDELQRYILE